MDKENLTVNTKPEDQENPVKEETTGEPEVKTRRRLKLQSPITIVRIPKKVKPEAAAEETPETDAEPETAHESKLKKVARGAAVVGLAIGTGLVALGSYLKGKEQGMADALSYGDDDSENPDETTESEPDPAGISTEENPNDD